MFNIYKKIEIDGKINLYSCYIDCDLRKFATINEEGVCYLLER